MSDEHGVPEFFVTHHEAQTKYDADAHPLVTKTNTVRHAPWDKECKACYPDEQ